MQHIHTNEEDDIINFKSKYLDLWNICNDGTDNDIGDMCPLIPIINTLNVENQFHHQNFENDGFTSSKSTIMDIFEFQGLL
jgi:hypothetical protein